ncbi:MAG: hypothetical protein M3Y71_04970 [Actinomycetota bacterium]|nr:hypothetical protein [Actinomycetota bacterium]
MSTSSPEPTTAEPYAGFEANRPVWDEWDAMDPEHQRDGFLEANATLQARYAGIDAETKRSLRVDLGSRTRRPRDRSLPLPRRAGAALVGPALGA